MAGKVAVIVLPGTRSRRQILQFYSTVPHQYAELERHAADTFVTYVGTDWGEMAAIAAICLLPAIVFLVFLQRYIVVGLTFGAVRE